MILLPIEIALKTAERMAKRRDVEITEEIKKVLLYAYEETEKDRLERGVLSEKLEF